MRNHITKSINSTQILLSNILEEENLLLNLEQAAVSCIHCLKRGGKVLLAGNGGSAADAQHFAGELVNRFRYDRPGLRAIALTTDTSILTSIANDHGYENIFARQIQALGNNGDVFIAYSTSGKSKNILKALETAHSMGLVCIGLTGIHHDQISPLCDHVLAIPSTATPDIQQIHFLFGHILCGLIEQKIYPQTPTHDSSEIQHEASPVS